MYWFKNNNISEVIIRNDLAHLEKQNMLIRARGGAIKVKLYHNGIDSPFSDKQKEFFGKSKGLEKQL